MFVVSNLLLALSVIVAIVLNILYWLILIRALVSWVNPDPNNFIVQFLRMVTEPILNPIRRMLPGSFRFHTDISPLIAVLLVIFLQSFLVQTLRDLAIQIR